MKWRGANPETEQRFATLQQHLDFIQAETRRLLQPERLAIVERAVDELRHAGIAERCLKAGDRAPEFELSDSDGRIVRSAELLVKGPLVLVFYRGRWCPYCIAQLTAMQAVRPEIEQAGASLLAISPQTPKHGYLTRHQHELAFPLLSDAGNQVARRFGLVYRLGDELRQQYQRSFVNLKVYNGDESWELPLPAVYVIGSHGSIVWGRAEADFRRRPEPEEILRAVRD